MSKRKIEISKGFEEEKRKEEEAFLKLSFEERFIKVCEISEIMLRMQYENGVLPKDENFTLRRKKD